MVVWKESQWSIAGPKMKFEDLTPDRTLVFAQHRKQFPAVRPEGAATCQPRAERNGVSRETPPWVGHSIRVQSPERAKPATARGSSIGSALSGLTTSFVTVTWGGAALCPRLTWGCPFGANRKCVETGEADLLNVALFGQTARQWRDANPKLEGNMLRTPRESAKPKRRHRLARLGPNGDELDSPGHSPGANGKGFLLSPEGAKHGEFRPFRADDFRDTPFPGLRPGLSSCAPSGLRRAFCDAVPELSPPALHVRPCGTCQEDRTPHWQREHYQCQRDQRFIELNEVLAA